MGDLALLAAAIGAEATVRRTWSTDTDKRLVLVDLPRVRTGPSEVGRAITEAQLSAFLDKVLPVAELGQTLGALAKWEGDESAEFVEEVEIAVCSAFPSTDLGMVTRHSEMRDARLRAAKAALLSVRSSREGNDEAAIHALLIAQRELVRALGGNDGLCDEAQRVRRAQLAEMGAAHV